MGFLPSTIGETCIPRIRSLRLPADTHGSPDPGTMKRKKNNKSEESKKGQFSNKSPRKSKDQTLPLGSRESFTWIILKTILCLVLDFQGVRFGKKNRIFAPHFPGKKKSVEAPEIIARKSALHNLTLGLGKRTFYIVLNPRRFCWHLRTGGCPKKKKRHP